MMPASGGPEESMMQRGRSGRRRHLGPRDDGVARRRGVEGGMARADAAALLVLGRIVVMAAVMTGVLTLACRDRVQPGRAGMDRLQRNAPQAGRAGQEEQRDEWQVPEARKHRGNLAFAAHRG